MFDELKINYEFKIKFQKKAHTKIVWLEKSHCGKLLILVCWFPWCAN